MLHRYCVEMLASSIINTLVYDCRENLNIRKYRSIKQFSEEVNRMFTNCELYNADDSEYHIEAVRQRLAFQKYLKKY